MSNTIEEQLASMRASLRRQRLFNLALVGIAITAATVAATRPAGDATFDTVTCKAWNVVDKDGKFRILAGTDAAGNALTTWLDKDGKMRISTATYANGKAATTWYGKDEKTRIQAFTNAAGTAATAWFDKDKKIRIEASTDAAGNAAMSLLDKDEKIRIRASTDADCTVTLPTTDVKP